MKKLGIGAVILGAVIVAGAFILKKKESMAVGIIGGADGPTSIFLAGKVNAGSGAAGIVIGIAVLIIGAVILWKRRK